MRLSCQKSPDNDEIYFCIENDTDDFILLSLDEAKELLNLLSGDIDLMAESAQYSCEVIDDNQGVIII